MTDASAPGRRPSAVGAAPGAVEAGALRASVVICAFTQRRWEQLQRAVASVHRQTVPVHEVLVVIDHNDDLYEQAAAGLDARVLRNADVQGLSGARNTGVRHATGEVVVFLDDDAWAEDDWLARLLDAYGEPTVLGVGGGVAPAFEGRRPRSLPPEFYWVVGCSYTGQPVVRSVVRNMIGANMSFRRSAFDRAGGFSTSLGRIGDRPLGCEETEFCIRAAAAVPGSRVVLEPAALVHHQVPPSRTSWSYFRSRCYSEGLSKAAVARLAGSGPGLASERSYATRTLPTGVARGLTDLLARRDATGPVRAAGIVVGLVWTTAGYVRGRLSPRVADGRTPGAGAGGAAGPVAAGPGAPGPGARGGSTPRDFAA